jgi:hypothetical protein
MYALHIPALIKPYAHTLLYAAARHHGDVYEQSYALYLMGI